MTFLHCLEEIKEMEVGGTTSCILHNFFSKVIITLRGLDNITKFNERNITQYLVFEGIDVVGQATLLVDEKIASLTEPSNGVWLWVWHFH
jgi:hypothetical protein